MYKLWTIKQVDELYSLKISNGKKLDKEGAILEKVLPTLKEYIGILEENYNPVEDVDPDTELGGVLYLFLEPIKKEYHKYIELMEKYHIASAEYAEIDEIIKEDEQYEYRLQIFILNSDFGLIFVFPDIRNSGENGCE